MYMYILYCVSINKLFSFFDLQFHLTVGREKDRLRRFFFSSINVNENESELERERGRFLIQMRIDFYLLAK